MCRSLTDKTDLRVAARVLSKPDGHLLNCSRTSTNLDPSSSFCSFNLENNNINNNDTLNNLDPSSSFCNFYPPCKDDNCTLTTLICSKMWKIPSFFWLEKFLLLKKQKMRKSHLQRNPKSSLFANLEIKYLDQQIWF